MTTYTKDQLDKVIVELNKTIGQLDISRTNLLLNQRINNNEFQLLGNQINNMSNQVNNLNTELLMRTFDDITVKEGTPGANLIIATANLNAAVARLEQIQQSLLDIAAVINAVTDITFQLMRRFGGL